MTGENMTFWIPLALFLPKAKGDIVSLYEAGMFAVYLAVLA
jgi:hypothetical protein